MRSGDFIREEESSRLDDTIFTIDDEDTLFTDLDAVLYCTRAESSDTHTIHSDLFHRDFLASENNLMVTVEFYDRTIFQHWDIFWVPSHLHSFTLECESLCDISMNGDNVFRFDEIDENSLLDDTPMSS
jgi:hypothetical protein